MNNLLSLLLDTWRFFRKHLLALCAVVLPFAIPIDLLHTFIVHSFHEESAAEWLSMIPGALLFPIYQAALILYIASAISGNFLPLNEYYRRAIKFWPPLMALYIVTMLATSFGFFLLVIPGFIVIARTAFSEFYCILFDQQPLDAFKDSWDNTRDYQWYLLSGLAIVWLITTMPVWLIETAITRFDAASPLLTFLSGVAASVLAIPLTIFAFRVFTVHQNVLEKHEQASI